MARTENQGGVDWASPNSASGIVLNTLSNDFLVLLSQFAEEEHGVELDEDKNVAVRWISIDQAFSSIESWGIDEYDRGTPHINQLQEAMQNHTFLPPVVLDGEDVIDGRHRIHAAKKLHFKVVPAIEIADTLKPRSKKMGKTKSPKMLVDDPKTYAEVRSDPRQVSLYGPEHEKELQEMYAKPNEPGFKSALLRSAGLISMIDLDDYDSELTQDLLSLHDEIALNPVRGFSPDYKTPYAQKKVWTFTWNALQNRLIPAINKAVPYVSAKAQKTMRIQLDAATGKMTTAQGILDRTENYSQAGRELEHAFSLLHDAIEIVRDDTRKVPAVRNIRPPAFDAYRDFS